MSREYEYLVVDGVKRWVVEDERGKFFCFTKDLSLVDAFNQSQKRKLRRRKA